MSSKKAMFCLNSFSQKLLQKTACAGGNSSEAVVKNVHVCASSATFPYSTVDIISCVELNLNSVFFNTTNICSSKTVTSLPQYILQKPKC